MSQLWTFSPSSQLYLERCLSAALPQETDNKWSQKFGRKNTKVKNNSDIPEQKTPTEIIEVTPSPEELEKNEQIPTEIIEITPSPKELDKNESSVSHDFFFDNIEHEIRLDVIAKESSKNPKLLSEMARRLSTNTVEKLFNLIFTTKDLEKSLLTALFHEFLVAYIKQSYSWLCVDILSKTNEIYPKLFQDLLKILLEDKEIPHEVLNNYVSTFNEEKNAKFMQNLINIGMSSEAFLHNILMIYTVYKDCSKTDEVQNYVRTYLIQCSKGCSSNRNYGRLFLAYLQAEKVLERTVNVEQLEECLELHRSPFKRPCVMLLKEFVNNE